MVVTGRRRAAWRALPGPRRASRRALGGGCGPHGAGERSCRTGRRRPLPEGGKGLKRLDRREFLEKAGGMAAALGALYLASTLPGCGGREGCPLEEGEAASPGELPAPAETSAPVGLVVVEGGDPAAMVKAGLAALGGLEALRPAGKRVLIKVNAAFARPPEDAATTHPELVAEVVRGFREAGASEVIVYDHILQDLVEQTLERNGIGAAARAAGASLSVYAVRKPGPARVLQIPAARALPSVGILEDIFKADVLVNMPKAKHHSGAGLSMAMKNLIGCTADMGKMHQVDLHRAIAELNTVVRPSLVILDATSVLLDNGPGGPGKVGRPGRIVLGTDPVAVDSYACGFFGVAPASLGYLRYGEELGVGTTDYRSLGVKEVSA